MRHPRRYAITLLSALLAVGCSDGPSEPGTGALLIRIAGLPTDAEVSFRLTSAGQAERMIGSRGIEGLAPGEYRLIAPSVVLRGARWDPEPVEQTVRVVAGVQPSVADVSFDVRTGGLVIVPQGIDAGVRGSFLVRGPDGFERTVAGYDTVTGLASGRYVVSASPISTPADSWTPAIETSETLISVAVQPFVVTMPFTLTTGRIALDVTDIPAGTDATKFQLSGPNGFARDVTAGATISGLAPGDYALTAPASALPGLVAVPIVQRLRVVAGATPTRASVRYTARPSLDFFVAGITVTQSIQRADNSIPLVAGKPAVVRVAVVANEANVATPRVRVSVLHDGVSVATALIEAPRPGVPTVRRDDDAMGSWNFIVPASLVRAGLAISAVVDPDGEFAEADDGNNSSPSTALAVRSVAPLHVKVVPVHHAASGTTGSADGGSRFLDMTYRMFPVADVIVDVRSPFVTSAPPLQPDDANGAWRQILTELHALRVVESASASEIYYGVIRAPYQSGIAGIATIGAPVGLGWDWQPSASGIAAHELGHTWGRLHAPCGAPFGAADESYPYAGGISGVLGYDMEARRVRSPSSPDLMGYCGDPWISDYTYLGVMSFRETQSLSTITGRRDLSIEAPKQSSLLVWGRIRANGDVILEPSFEVMARPSIPTRRGVNRLRGLSTTGRTLFDFTFDGESIADGVSGDRSFAFTIPLDADERAQLATVHVTSHRAEVRQLRRNSTSGVPQRLSAERDVATSGRVRWNATEHPVALLRQAGGKLLGFVRGGNVSVPPGDVEILLPTLSR